MATDSSILAWKVPWTEEPGGLCHNGGVICMSEIIDISPGNLDSSVCFFQPSVSYDILCV